RVPGRWWRGLVKTGSGSRRCSRCGARNTPSPSRCGPRAAASPCRVRSPSSFTDAQVGAEDFTVGPLRIFVILAASCCLLGGFTTQSATAADTPLKIEQEWKGNRKDVDNDAYLKDLDGKDEAVITNSKAWTKLWKAWNSDKPVPKVDFENY